MGYVHVLSPMSVFKLCLTLRSDAGASHHPVSPKTAFLKPKCGTPAQDPRNDCRSACEFDPVLAPICRVGYWFVERMIDLMSENEVNPRTRGAVGQAIRGGSLSISARKTGEPVPFPVGIRRVLEIAFADE
jgi:hypothetical protein